MGKINKEKRKVSRTRKIGNIMNMRKAKLNLNTESLNMELDKNELLTQIPMINTPTFSEDYTMAIGSNKTTEASYLYEGRRIVDVAYFFKQLQAINTHAPAFSCSINNLILIQEIRKGLSSDLCFKCNMCNGNFIISTNDKDDKNMDINTGAVSGIISIGSGYYNFEEIMTSMNIPCMSQQTFTKCQNKINSVWEEAALICMEQAVKKEAEYARKIQNVDENGTPLITVVGDGCWSRRSYGTNYNALSGIAALIGFHYKQILYIGVKNKYCMICNRNKKYNVNTEHRCYKNCNGSSTSMESAILVEGFKSSMANHGVIYNKIIADGDSSTYKKIIEARPYSNVTVEKIEC